MSLGFIIQVLVFFTFTGYVMLKYGVRKSISDAWYVLPTNQRWMFTMFVWGIALPLAFYQNTYFIISMIGLMVTGATPMYKLKASSTNIIHTLGAIVGILFGFVGLYSVWDDYVMAIVFIILAIVLKVLKVKNFLWWIEFFAFILIMSSIYLTTNM